MEGSVNLARNSEHYVRRIDVQHLIRQVCRSERGRERVRKRPVLHH
jgi:hypothetical protein